MGSSANAADDTALQSLLDAEVAKGAPGLSAAIVSKDGVLWAGVSGKENLTTGAPVRTDHLFGIGSITKTFSAVVILQLVEEGRLSLDATPLELLGADVVGKVPGADKATLAQLMNHTSGIPSWEDDPLWIREGRGADLDVKHIWGRTETLPYIDKTPLTGAPGEKYSYANTNHTLIGLIIEKITGNDVVDEIRKRILKPVGISDIYLEGFQVIPTDRVATRYHYATPEFKRDAGLEKSFKPVTADLIDVSSTNLSVEWTAGGMVATATDLAKYAAAFRAGKLLKPESMAFVKEWFPAGGASKVGHGVFYLPDIGGHALLGHSGSVLGFTGSMLWYEDVDISVVVLANVGTMHIGQRLPNASSVARSEAFVKATYDYVKALKK